jgi:hypothetical protein
LFIRRRVAASPKDTNIFDRRIWQDDDTVPLVYCAAEAAEPCIGGIARSFQT